jgi:hypothetical protein
MTQERDKTLTFVVISVLRIPRPSKRVLSGKDSRSLRVFLTYGMISYSDHSAISAKKKQGFEDRFSPKLQPDIREFVIEVQKVIVNQT